MVVTDATFQPPMFPLNAVADWNMANPMDTYAMAVTVVTETNAIVILKVPTVARVVRAGVLHSRTSRATRCQGIFTA
jgi:hypothetical protein